MSFNSLHLMELEKFGLSLVQMRNTVKNHGMKMVTEKSNQTPRQLEPNETFDDMLRWWYEGCEPNDCSIIVIPDRDEDQYAAIKRMADLTIGSHTLCVVGRKKGKPVQFNLQFQANLAMKINMKMGGDNHHLDNQKLNTILTEKVRKQTIILGADVTHPGAAGASGAPSIACVVGSVDKNFVNYPGSMRLQGGGKEVSVFHIDPLGLRH